MTAKNFLFILFLCLTSVNADAVPAAPNGSVVTGTVIECGITSSARSSGNELVDGFYNVVVKVERAEDVPDMLNFLADKKGQEIEFRSRERLDASLFGKKIKASVEYRGDERGGGFWIRNITIVKY